ncbi:hypothetical protein [Dokdonella soli]|uniref:Uncharacterized protein n=1 Tax=Dokdonella soli TaxID=529810 RepID=A0ABN1IIP5_9GAMM
MNSPAPDTRRQKQTTLIALVGASVVLGIVDAALALPLTDSPGRLAFTFGGNLALLILGFRWLQLDAAELDIRRPTWLNVGIVLLAAVFVPYYLYKTRPANHRLPAIAGFFGLVFACMFASAMGALLMSSMSGTPATP